MVAPYYERDGVTLYLGDCLDVLPTLGPVDLAVADPPYTFGLASTSVERKAGSWGDLMNGARWYADWLGELKRLTAERQGAAWVFNSWRSFPVLAKAAHDVWPIESLLVWDKVSIGPGGTRGLRPRYELVALHGHPGFRIPDRGVPDIWEVKRAPHRPDRHPAEKPYQLVFKLLAAAGVHYDEDYAVLDPFAGSGVTLLAARGLGYRAVGIEVEERYAEAIVRRLEVSDGGDGSNVREDLGEVPRGR